MCWEDSGDRSRSWPSGTITHAFTPENPLIVNTGVLTASNVTTGLRTYFSAYSPLKVSNKGLPAAMWSAGSCKFGPKLKWTGSTR
jgi:aldehyde:ferredoxin oxidoreductase